MFVIDGPPPFVPGMCMLTKRNDGQILDLDRDFDPDHVGRMYLHTDLVRDMWEAVRHLYEQPVEDTRDQRIAELEEELSRLEKVVDSVYTLKQHGYSTQKKPGRKPKKEPVTSGS